MPKTGKSRSKYVQYTYENLTQALEEHKKGRKLWEISKTYKIPHSTLYKKAYEDFHGNSFFLLHKMH